MGTGLYPDFELQDNVAASCAEDLAKQRNMVTPAAALPRVPAATETPGVPSAMRPAAPNQGAQNPTSPLGNVVSASADSK